MLDLQHDRVDAAGAEALVDALRQRAHPRFEVLVFVQRGAAGRGDLHEGEPPDHARMQFQHALDRLQAFEDALGVVEPVDADRHSLVVRQAQFARAPTRGTRHRRFRLQRLSAARRSRSDRARPGSARRRRRWSRLRARCGFPGSGRRFRGNSCSGRACGSPGSCCRAGLPGFPRATGRCRRIPGWARGCART